jgi:transposase
MKYSRFSGADRFGPCRLHADIYEPTVNYLGMAGGIVTRGERHRPGVAMPPDMRMAQIFVAVMGASNFTYVEATWTQALGDWIGAHTRAFAAIGGVLRGVAVSQAALT